INYSGLESFGPQVVTFLQRYNPFFWWGVILISSLLLIYMLAGFVQRSYYRNQKQAINATQFEQLVQQLSESGREVLQWVWVDSRYPITVGNIQQALKKLRAGRVRQIELAQRHTAILQALPKKPVSSDVEHY